MARFWTGLAVSAVCLAVLAGTASPAQAADGDPVAQIQDGTASTGMKAAFDEWVKCGSVPAGAAVGYAAMSLSRRAAIARLGFQAAAAAGAGPATGAAIGAGSIGTGIVVAGIAAWAIHKHFAEGDCIMETWLDSRALGKDALYNLDLLPGPFGNVDSRDWLGVGWQHRIGVGTTNCPSALGTTDCYVFTAKPILNVCCTFGYGGNWSPLKPGAGVVAKLDGSGFMWKSALYSQCVAGGFAYCSFGQDPATYPSGPADTIDQLVYAHTQTVERLMDENPDVVQVPISDGFGIAPQYAYYLPTDQMHDSLIPTTSDDTFPGSPDFDTDFDHPAAFGQTDRLDALAPYDDDWSRGVINWLLDPESYPDPGDPPAVEDDPAEGETATITLPKPELQETFAHYRARLREEGWLGVATQLVLSEDLGDPEQGPNTVVRITGDYLGTVHRRLWPGTDPLVRPHEAITFRVNPAGYTPVDPTEDPAEGGTPAPVDTSSCDFTEVGAVDVSPVTELDYGDKFPFGVFTWALGIVGLFDVTPDAPHWVITSLGPDDWSADWNLDLEPFSPYMATMRTVLAWVMWVGAIWFLATTFLGFRATGNPGDAVDGYLDELI